MLQFYLCVNKNFLLHSQYIVGLNMQHYVDLNTGHFNYQMQVSRCVWTNSMAFDLDAIGIHSRLVDTLARLIDPSEEV